MENSNQLTLVMVQEGDFFSRRLARIVCTYRRILAATPDYLDKYGRPDHPE